ncbi:MAG: carboxypeptidase-like regulatory domain-containing protein [Planctomycetes bacterium]|nr:carboxypeptidase-like regulatory domain-containing protein [Planctomycetota bacterium]
MRSSSTAKALTWLVALALALVAALWFAARELARRELDIAGGQRTQRVPSDYRGGASADALGASRGLDDAEPTDPSRADALDGVARQSALGTPHALELRFADGRPLVGAHVLAFDGDRLLDRAVSDATGRASVSTPTERVQLLIAGANLVPDFRAVQFAPGRLGTAPTRIELPAGVLAGTFRPLDARLDRTVTLHVESDRPWFVAQGLGDVVRRSVPSDWLDPIAREVQADADGRFRFEGLSEPWSGMLRVGPECTLYAGSPPLVVGLDNRARLGELRDDLVFEVFQRPRLVGRIVETPGGRGVGGLVVSLGVSYATGSVPVRADADTRLSNATTDGDGAFGVWLPEQRRAEDSPRPSWPAIDAVSLSAQDADGALLRHVTLQASQLRGPFDLGEVPLSSPADERVEFNVHDPRNQPIAGARVQLGADGARTDAQGRACVARTAESWFVASVAARGFRTATVDVAGRSTVDVTLERAPELALRFVRADGLPAASLDVEFGGPGVADRLGFEFGNASWRRTTGADGRVTLDGVLANAEIDVVARGAFGEELERFSVVADDKSTEQELVLAVPTTRVHGIVTDPNQNPLVGVHVIAHRDSETVTRTSDASGEFTIDWVVPGALRFALEKPGFAPEYRDEPEVGSGHASFHFRLLEARTVLVRAEDTSGRGVPFECLRIAWATRPETLMQRLSAAGVRIDPAPAEGARVEACIAGVRYVRELGANERELVFAVPDHGRARFDLHFSSDEERQAWAQRGGSLSVLVRDVEGTLEPQRAYFSFGSTALTLDYLLPGEYEACFECGDTPDAAARAAVRFRVRANDTTTVVLAP